MPVELSVSLDAREVKNALRDIGPKAVRTAANQAINKALTGARTDATKFLAPKAEVKKVGTVRKKIELQRVTRDGVTKGAQRIPAY